MADEKFGDSPHVLLSSEARIKERIVAFWNELRVTEDIGVTSWEVLETIEREVTECLNHAPPDIGRAMTLTLGAQFMVVGLVEL